MKRVVLAGCAACLCAYAVLAASPEVESAIKAFKAVSGDPGKVQAFCTMTKTLDSLGDNDDEAAEAKVNDLMKQLGPDFEAAWKTAENVEEDSDDGKALNAALDEAVAKCGKQ
jgi:hypothetical protein